MWRSVSRQVRVLTWPMRMAWVAAAPLRRKVQSWVKEAFDAATGVVEAFLGVAVSVGVELEVGGSGAGVASARAGTHANSTSGMEACSARYGHAQGWCGAVASPATSSAACVGRLYVWLVTRIR